MTVSRGFAIVRSVGVSASGAMRSCVEKANKTNDFRHDRRRDDQPDKRRGLKDRRRSSSQNDTRQDVPFWNGPRLRATFVAQVIGQMAGENAPDTQSALASYTHVEAWNLFFDRSV
jgi:hypothetical protein